ncbi:patatin-like protein [Sphingomonas quercus]|uniref:Patatin-like protein n=1 Tax=Sphingomonas quercus TaxID=2842451 RepID=A0ABS6BM69_9SPHN|nr:patatin-like protein [Sphingomonas quercus]MBU3079423.1 patatin-like protein [Sphingomonas quercus]
MREKELRLALVCYGGISLAVYMHGITKEVWRLCRASRALHAGEWPEGGSEAVYLRLMDQIATTTDTRLRVLCDILTGASAGGINAIFLAQAIASGQSLEPLTDLWLELADIEKLIDPEARPGSRFAKFWAQPLVWAAARRGDTVDETVEPDTRAEVRAKLSGFMRSRWFEPPFTGEGFTHMILDALDAMAEAPAGPALLPNGQPLDLTVTLTDFHGHAERIQLHSPPEVLETEHRLMANFSDRGAAPRHLGAAAELAFAARATASFPGAFPPFRVDELDRVLADRGARWPGRDEFLARVLPDHAAIGAAESAVLIDGSVLANAPFQPAIDALVDRPARREVDRRIVYIDPKPNIRSIGMRTGDRARPPGFFTTILAALSDLPRSQPIRDNLERVDRRSARITALRQVVEGLRPEVDAAIESGFGQPLLLDRPTPARLAAWRARAHDAAARGAGYAYASYGHLKLAAVCGELAALIHTLAGGRDAGGRDALRAAILSAVHAAGVDAPGALSAGGANEAAKTFFRTHDLGFRIRRLRFLARSVQAVEERRGRDEPHLDAFRVAIFAALAPYLDRQRPGFYDETARAAARICRTQPQATLDWLGDLRNLRAVDDEADALLADALAGLGKADRREMLLAYLGYPFYDIATLALLRGEGLEEFDPIKVDRIAPDDATSIRKGGAAATLKGIQFNSFGAFFSRAWRENDYLWGRLHGAERMIDILVSAIPEGRALPPGTVATAKRDLFRAILAEEQGRLAAIPELFTALAREIG